jgi:hypothetical protein
MKIYPCSSSESAPAKAIVLFICTLTFPRVVFSVVFLCLHTRTHTPFFISKCMHGARGNEARSAGQKTMTPVSARGRAARSHLIAAFVIIIFCSARASVVREQKKQRAVAQRQ